MLGRKKKIQAKAESSLFGSVARAYQSMDGQKDVDERYRALKDGKKDEVLELRLVDGQVVEIENPLDDKRLAFLRATHGGDLGNTKRITEDNIRGINGLASIYNLFVEKFGLEHDELCKENPIYCTHGLTNKILAPEYDNAMNVLFPKSMKTEDRKNPPVVTVDLSRTGGRPFDAPDASWTRTPIDIKAEEEKK